MIMERQINLILRYHKKGNITTEEAKNKILALLDDVGRSEQLKCMMNRTDGNCDCGIGSCIEGGW